MGGCFFYVYIIQRAREKCNSCLYVRKIVKDKVGGVFGEVLIVDKEGAKDEGRST